MEQLFLIGVDSSSLGKLRRLTEEVLVDVDRPITIVLQSKLEQILSANLVSIPALKFRDRVFYFKNIQDKIEEEQIDNLKRFIKYDKTSHIEKQ